MFYEGIGPGFVRKFALELFGLDLAENFADAGAVWDLEVPDEVVAGDEGFGNEGLLSELFLLSTNKVVVVAEAIRAVAIDAVEFGLELESFRRHEAFELGGAHVLNVHELHVSGDHEADVIDGLVGVAEAAEDDFGHLGTDFIVTVEAVAPGFGVPGLSGGLTDIVKEDGEGEIERWVFEEGEGDAGVDVNIALGVPLGWLFAALEVEDFGEKLRDEAGVGEEVEAAGAVIRGDDAGEFVADALGRNLGKERGAVANGGPGLCFDFKTGGDGEADGAEEAESVFFEAFLGVADGAEGARFEIGPAVDVVDDFAGEGILKEAVDGEVAALGVFLGRGEFNGFGAATVFVGAIGAEGGDLDHFVIAFHDDDAEVCADGIGSFEKGLDLGGSGGGGEVVVLGFLAEELVADGTTGKVDDMTSLAQDAGGFDGELFLAGHDEGKVVAMREGGNWKKSDGFGGALPE